MMDSLLSLALVIAMVLGICAGAALALGGSMTAALVDGRTDAWDVPKVRRIALVVALFGLLLFVASGFAALHWAMPA